MPRPGVPYSPGDPDGERPVVSIPSDQLPIDLGGGVQLADREGVFAQSFTCPICTLHFVLFSWSRTRHRPGTVTCPDVTEVSRSRTFRFDPGREPEIYDLWPFKIWIPSASPPTGARRSGQPSSAEPVFRYMDVRTEPMFRYMDVR